LLGLALALPQGTGSFGPVAAELLRGGFGEAAWLAIAALLAISVIVFLELHAMRKLAIFAGCAALEFLVLDAWFGLTRHGGQVGDALAHGIAWLFGGAGARIVLAAAALGFIVTPTGLSLKTLFAAAAVRAARASSSAAAVMRDARARNAETKRFPLLLAGPPQSRQDMQAAPIDRAAPLHADQPVPQAEPLPPLDVAPESPERQFSPAAHNGDVMLPAVEPAWTPQPPIAAEARQSSGRPAYRLPDYALFNPPEKRVHNETSAALLLEETLDSFGVSAKVTHIERGPSITRYEMTPGKGVKVSAIKSLADNIQLALAAQSVRIEAPIPGKAAVGIEVPNSAVSVVAIREILDYLPHGEGQLYFGLGKDITGRPIIGDLSRMPHLLVAGATGAGKSVCLNVMLASFLSTCTPDQVQLLLIDPKRVELTSYNGIPHLISDCITDPKLAAGALLELTKEMDARYERFALAGVRKIEEYNQAYSDEPLPFIVVVIDELADLMLVAPTRVETSICRLAQIGRATGIHLIVATQRPSVDVITGLIKANIPSRIAFAVSSQVDSRTIIDMAGAERLLGRGDMLYLPIDAPKPVRVQGALVTGPEIERLCEFWRMQDDPDNRIDIEPSEIEEDGRGPSDELAFDAAKIIIERQMASVALLQAELKVGHPRAVRLMKLLEDFRVVGPAEGTKPRKILVGDADVSQLALTLNPRRTQQPLL